MAQDLDTPRRSARRTRSRGVALVEFAIAAPFLFMLVFGVIDGTRAFVAFIEIKNAAREGAVFGQSHPHQWEQDSDSDDGDLCDDGNTIVDHVRAESDLPLTITVTYGSGSTLAPNSCRPPSSANPITGGTEISVQVQTPFNAVTPIIGRFIDDVTATASTRAQG